MPASLRVTFRDIQPLTKPVCAAVVPSSSASREKTTNMHDLINKLCANVNLTEPQQAQLRALCHKYDDIFNDGSRPLAMTNLTKFKVELNDIRKPLSCAPRPVSHVKREEIRKIVE